jgi:hypothetical protein
MCFASGGGLALPTFRALLCLACLCVVSARTAQAGLITSDYLSYPNLEAAGIYGGYTASTGVFWAEGCPASYSVSSLSQQDLMPADGVLPWSFSISAELNASAPTPMAASGTVAIYGSTTGTEGSGKLLLQGNIEAFGSSIDPLLDPSTTLFQITFHVTGGAYAADYGDSALIILSPGFITGWGPATDDTPFAGDLLHDFHFNGLDGVADVVVIPEPSWGVLAFTLLAGGLVALFSRRHGTRRDV